VLHAISGSAVEAALEGARSITKSKTAAAKSNRVAS
jgi:hypothetical protein